MVGTLFTRQRVFVPVVDMVRPPSSGSTGGAKETAPWEVSNLHERAKSLTLERGTVADVRDHRNFVSSRFSSGSISV